ncbi:hypothetical protein V8G54_029107 [Vigna mungo]|uniref:G protein gamma domain-containing protein n=1 Tax=Vigna mungo TaxID=3915 RepID=A0AAQ3RK07_VIGMU
MITVLVYHLQEALDIELEDALRIKGFWHLIYGLNSLVFDEPIWLAFHGKEELEKLERMEKASTACKGLLSNVETKPDPLLPSTIGPVSPTWDRWFEGPQDSKGCCRCWIL